MILTIPATPSFNKAYHEMPGAKEWINTNAFTARLIGAKIVNWETFPIWALREAFEEPFRSVAENDIHALVAAQWIFHAGKIIYELSVEESLVENPRITKGGSLFDGESGFNIKRWAFWKKRAGELNNEASDEVRGIASAVVEKMSEIEGK
ncbi:hypothetical protein N7481_007001 [Penicillium waksmanii]|uniref:uncharacterized protein n=1 Tax=Penicillium waksmanii TaxID=69791 RepID=UPI0025493D9F|nr:uncharacterized protein N7481_007001 [Penicillium waksmanii]KAJ5979703.1 hypothetical protein N7481_007001 [Penicillium waksmanii]